MKHQVSTSATLLEILAILSPDSSKSTLRSWLQHGRVTVDGKVVKVATQVIQRGQSVEVIGTVKRIDDKIKVIYEDKHIIVVDKPGES